MAARTEADRPGDVLTILNGAAELCRILQSVWGAKQRINFSKPNRSHLNPIAQSKAADLKNESMDHSCCNRSGRPRENRVQGGCRKSIEF